jgi:hypothetical protein
VLSEKACTYTDGVLENAITEGTEDTESTEKNAKTLVATDGAQMHTDKMQI